MRPLVSMLVLISVHVLVFQATVAGAVEALSGLPAGCCEPPLAKLKLKGIVHNSVSPELVRNIIMPHEIVLGATRGETVSTWHQVKITERHVP